MIVYPWGHYWVYTINGNVVLVVDLDGGAQREGQDGPR